MNVPLWLATSLAGGLGAACRFTVDSQITRALTRRRATPDLSRLGGLGLLSTVPVGTLVVNLSACFLLGLLTGFLGHTTLTTVIGTGFLGGYSTFSTAYAETAMLLLSHEESRARTVALLHAAAMTGGTLAAALVGLWLGTLAA